ncbi:MAG: ubiquinone/menaquinone biosynthesis methyltransferase [Pseudomonadota bacterium]|nr:ubiquinone/menaquinone biosynthesis methyltransferase [Pseudomonadota bacterium]
MSGELLAGDGADGPVPGDPNRAPAVRDMFARIAPGYDRANKFMSMGIDRAWRRIAIRALGDRARGDILDLCAGTMDFTAALAPTAKSIVALDFCAPMLEAGMAKIPAGANVRTVCADARELPLAGASFDAVVIGFGIRNVPEPERALAEARRVLRPGGVLVVVDFFRPTTLAQRFFAGTYNRVVLPIVGGLVTGDASAYRYLAGSMAAWYDREGFEGACTAAGFARVTGRELFPPVASLVVARVEG